MVCDPLGDVAYLEQMLLFSLDATVAVALLEDNRFALTPVPMSRLPTVCCYRFSLLFSITLLSLRLMEVSGDPSPLDLSFDVACKFGRRLAIGKDAVPGGLYCLGVIDCSLGYSEK